MIDIHTHILPGIDDGVETEDEAVEFARVARADGVRTIVATPHCKEGFYENGRDAILARVARLAQRLKEERIDVELVPGAEVHICPDLEDRIADGRAPTLADNGKTLLLELSLSQNPVQLENLVFQLKLAGIEILFAHPERIRYFQDDVKRYEEVVRLGAYGQITTGSVLGIFGSEAAEFSRLLLERGLVHIVASDAHNTRGRPPILSEAVRAMAEMIGETRSLQMAHEAPASLLRGEGPKLAEVERPVRRPRTFLSRVFRRG
jgi:protein-tyrosine phosphatase